MMRGSAVAVAVTVMTAMAGCSGTGPGDQSGRPATAGSPAAAGRDSGAPARPGDDGNGGPGVPGGPGPNGALNGWQIRAVGKAPVGAAAGIVSDGRYVFRPAQQQDRRSVLAAVNGQPMFTHDPGDGWHTEDAVFTDRWLVLVDKQDEDKGDRVRGIRIDLATAAPTALPPPGSPAPTDIQSWSISAGQAVYASRQGDRECLVLLDLAALTTRLADCAAPGEFIEYLAADAGYVAFTGNRPLARAADGRSCRTIYTGRLDDIRAAAGQTPCWGFAGAAVPGGAAWHEETLSDVFDGLGPLMLQAGTTPPRRIDVPAHRDDVSGLGSLRPCRGWIYAVVEHNRAAFTEIQRWKPDRPAWEPVYRSPVGDSARSLTTRITCHGHGIGFARVYLGEGTKYEEALVAH
jgi:hypothetical protein